MKIDALRKKMVAHQGKYFKMTARQRKTWYGQWIAWRLRNMTARMKDIERSVGRHHRTVGNYTNKN